MTQMMFAIVRESDAVRVTAERDNDTVMEA
jgi:hypothetical protein